MEGEKDLTQRRGGAKVWSIIVLCVFASLRYFFSRLCIFGSRFGVGMNGITQRREGARAFLAARLRHLRRLECGEPREDLLPHDTNGVNIRKY